MTLARYKTLANALSELYYPRRYIYVQTIPGSLKEAMMSIQEQIEAKLQEQIDKATAFIKNLSPAQRIVLQQMSKGKDNAVIARELKVPLTTVVGRLHGIYADAKIPDSVSSRKEKREILVGMYRAFEKKFELDDDGHFVRRPDIPRSLPTPPAQPISPSPTTENPAPSVSEAPPLANGHTKEITIPVEKPLTPEAIPTSVTPGYGVALSVPLHNPESILDVTTVTLGAPDARTQLQALLRDGYRPEIINEFQSLTSTKGVTRVILVKRR